MAKPNTFQTSSGNRLFPPPIYRAELNLSRSGEYRAVEDGLITTPIHIAPRTRVLPEYEVEILKQARISGATDDEMREVVHTLMKARKKNDWRKMLAEVA